MLFYCWISSMSYDTVRFISRQRSELAASQNLWRQKVEFFFKWRNSGHFCVQKTFWNWTLCSCQNVLLFLINLSGLGLVLWMTRWKQHYILTPEKKRLINLICLPRHFWLTREEDVGSRLEEVQLYKILDSWALLLRHIQRMRTYPCHVVLINCRWNWKTENLIIISVLWNLYNK